MGLVGGTSGWLDEPLGFHQPPALRHCSLTHTPPPHISGRAGTAVLPVTRGPGRPGVRREAIRRGADRKIAMLDLMDPL